jgi:phage terminase small subunit
VLSRFFVYSDRKGGWQVDFTEIDALRKACGGKKAKFAEEYIKDFNGTAAAIRAGYKEHAAAQQASRMLRDPAVLAYRNALVEAAASAAGVCKDNLIVKTEEIYRRAMQNKEVERFNPITHEWEGTGEYVFDSRGAAKALELQAKLIGALSEKHIHESEGGISLNVSVLADGDGQES